MNNDDIILTYTRSILNHLNDNLRLKCGGTLQIKLYKNDELTNVDEHSIYENIITDFVICLVYTNALSYKNCISSISCKINDDNSLEFSSMTNPMFEKKKYNLLLRSVLIQICQFIHIRREHKIYRINKIISRAINPISIYLLSKYFNAHNDKLEIFMEEKSITHKKLTPELTEEFYNSLDDDIMDIEDEEEAARRFKKNSKFGSPILMTIDLSNPEYTILSRIVFQTTINTLQCPSTQSAGTNKTRITKRRRKRGRKTRYKRKH